MFSTIFLLIKDSERESVVPLENAYLRTLILLEDGNMLVAKAIMENLTTELESTGEKEYIKVKLPEELRDEIEKLAEG